MPGFSCFAVRSRGEARAPLCGMGVCYECRVTIDGIPHQRACMTTVTRGMAIETATCVVGESMTSSVERVDVARHRRRAGGDGRGGVRGGAGCARLARGRGNASGGTDLASEPDKDVACRCASMGRSIDRERRGSVGRRRRSSMCRLSARMGSRSPRTEADGPLRIEARRLILATGARERFLPFPGWTLPNVFGIGGAQALLKTGMSFRGLRVVIAGSGPLLLPVAAVSQRGGRQAGARCGTGAGAPRCGFRGVALAQPVDARSGGEAPICVHDDAVRDGHVDYRGEGELRACNPRW